MTAFADRADLVRQLAGMQRNAKVYGDTVRPYWSPDRSSFAYRTLTPEGPEWRLVDPATASRRPLFDRAQLAADLAAQIGEDVDATKLAIADFRLEQGGAFRFTYSGKAWRCDADGRALTRTGDAPPAGAVPAPDGSASVLEAGANIVLVEGDKRTPLTTDGEPDNGYGDFRGFNLMLMGRLHPGLLPPVALWSPDSMRIATLKADLRGVDHTHLVQHAAPGTFMPVLHSYAFATPQSSIPAKLDLVFLDRAGAKTVAKLDLKTFGVPGIMLGRAWWDADGRHFHLINDDTRDGNQVTFWRIDSHTGEAERLLRDTTPGVARLAITSEKTCRVLNDKRVIWSSARDGWTHLYLVTPGSDAWIQLTRGDWRVNDVLHVDEAKGVVFFTGSGENPAVDPYFQNAYSVRFEGLDLRRLTPEDMNHDFTPPLPDGARMMAAMFGYGPGARGFSPDGRWFVVSHDAVDTPPVSLLRDASGVLVMELETADAGDAWPKDLLPPEPFHVTALDGETTLWGVVYKPLNFDAAKRYPVVEVIYGGPQIAVTPKGFRQTLHGSQAEQLAALGFVAVIIDGPGTPMRSLKFDRAAQGRIESCGGLDDHVAAIRELAADRAWMDIERMGIIGQSGGGYATVRALGAHGDFYKAGVSYCGNHDQRGYISLWGDSYQGLYDPELYEAQANATVAKDVTGALMLVHGDMDDNVHPAHTMRVVDALIAADKDFDLLIVPNVGHSVANHPYAARRGFDFLVRHLGPERP